MLTHSHIAVVACVIGANACLAPWAAHAMRLSAHPTHSDLWIALAGFAAGLAAITISRDRLRATAWMVIGVCECVVVAANWPTLWRASRVAGQTGVQGFLGDAAMERLVAYGVVAFAGITLFCVAAWLYRTPASPAHVGHGTSRGSPAATASRHGVGRTGEASMMFRVIDTIEYRENWTHRYPDLAAKGEGLLVVLEPEGPNPTSSLVGQSVSVRRPDGSDVTLTVDGVQRGARGVPGLFFRRLTAAEIPRGSVIEGS